MRICSWGLIDIDNATIILCFLMLVLNCFRCVQNKQTKLFHIIFNKFIFPKYMLEESALKMT